MATTHTINIKANDKSASTLSQVDKNLDRVTKRSLMFKGALGLAAGALAVFGAAKGLSNIIGGMDTLAKRARNVGAVTEEQFAKFQVLDRFMNEAGISTQEFDRAMRNVQGRMAQGLAGNKAYAEIMKKLGGSIFDANGKLKNTPDLMMSVMKAVEGGTISLDEAQKILGEMVGPKIFNAVKQLNKDGTSLGETLADVAGSMNIVGIEDAKQAEKFGDALVRLKEMGIGLLQEFITPFLPAMTTFVQDLAAKAPGYLAEFSAFMQKLQPVFTLIGNLLTSVVLPAFQLFIDTIVSLAEYAGPIVESLMPAFSKTFEVLGIVIKSVAEALRPLVDTHIKNLIEFVKNGVTTIDNIAKSFGGWQKILDSLVETVTNLGTKVKQTFEDMKKATIGKVGDMVDGIKGAFDWLKNDLVDNSVVPEMKAAIIKEFQEMDKVVVKTTNNTVDAVISDYDRLAKVMDSKTKDMKDISKDFVTSVNEDFNSTLADGLVEGNLSFSSFADLWKSTLKDLISDTLNGGSLLKDTFGSLFGGGGTGGGFNLGSLFSGGTGGFDIGSAFSSFSTGVGDFFGGFFANGGYLPSGKIGVAGEAGPELITGPANITPMDQVGGTGANVNITIQAIDTQTGTEFLLNNKKQIEGIIQGAFNRRGKQGIY